MVSLSKLSGFAGRKGPQSLGRLAQLGERRVRNAEVEGSNPLPSTTARRPLQSQKSSTDMGRLAQW